jgi:Icc protein
MATMSLTILQLSDLHILAQPQDTLRGISTENYFHRILSHAMQQPIGYDYVLLSGDLAQVPCLASYQRILTKLDDYSLEGVCLNGNHDDYALMQTVFNRNIHCKKQICFEKWQMIVLNSQIIGSEKGNLAREELNFLEICLQEKPNLFALIAMHHHCMPTHSEWLDTMQIANSTEFLEIVSKYPNAKVITTGHIHQEMDRQIGELRILGTPSTCYQFRVSSSQFALDKTPPGYRILKLFEDGRVESGIHRLETPLHELELEAPQY